MNPLSSLPDTMTAVVCPRYGSPDVLQLQQLPLPRTKPEEVLIQVEAASVNAGDWHLMRGTPAIMRLMFGFRRPIYPILGADVAGKVVAAGDQVTDLKVGDSVFGVISESGFGAFAQYVSVPASELTRVPESVSLEEAAATPTAAMTALQALRTHGNIQPGQQVLINGASGGVGTFAVQIAKAFGTEVTGVCSTGKVDTVRSLGADHVIDYTQEDLSRHGENYDLIMGANGDLPISAYKRMLKAKGTYVMSGGTMKQLFQAMLLGPLAGGGRKMGNMLMTPKREDLLTLTDLLETGKIRPVRDRSYSLSQVPEAIRYVEEGHARGKVVITDFLG